MIIRTQRLKLDEQSQPMNRFTYDIYRDDAMIGCVLYENTPDGFPYLYVIIQEEYRRQGYAKEALLGVIEHWNQFEVEAYTWIVEEGSVGEEILKHYTYDVIGYHEENGKRMWHYWVQHDVDKHNYIYMLRCDNNSLYTGWTNHVEQRFRAHKCGRGAKYTHAHTPLAIVYTEAFLTSKAAMRREYAIKQLTKEEKERLIAPWG